MKKISKFLLASLCTIPMALAVPACGNNSASDSGGGSNIESQDVFVTFESIQKKMAEDNQTLSVSIYYKSFDGQNKDEMGAEENLTAQLSQLRSYNCETGEYFYQAQEGLDLMTFEVCKNFDNNNIGYYSIDYEGNPYDDFLVDKYYGSFKVKQNIISQNPYDYSIFNSDGYCFLNYDSAIDRFEKRKQEHIASYDNCEVSYSVEGKKESGNFVVEGVYFYKTTEEYSTNSHTYRYIFTFNKDFLLSVEKIEEYSYQSVEGDSYYNYRNDSVKFSQEFHASEFEQINTSSFSLPHNKVTQDLKIYVNDSFYSTYDAEFGTPVSDYASLVSTKENSSGYEVYMDAQHTIACTNQVTKSHQPTTIYLISKPAQDYATIITKYIYEKKSGERVVESINSQILYAIDMTFPDDPLDGVFYNFPTTHSGAKFYYEKVYLNGEVLENNYFLADPNQIYYLDIVHKQSDTIKINLYDRQTGQLWNTVTEYEKGMLWGYIEDEINSNESFDYYGLDLSWLSLRFVDGKGGSITISDGHVTHEDMDVYISFYPEAGETLFRYSDLSGQDAESATIRQYSTSEIVRYRLADFETLIIDNVEVKVDGVIKNTSFSSSQITYDSSLEMIKISLTGGRIYIQYKYADSGE